MWWSSAIAATETASQIKEGCTSMNSFFAYLSGFYLHKTHPEHINQALIIHEHAGNFMYPLILKERTLQKQRYIDQKNKNISESD